MKKKAMMKHENSKKYDWNAMAKKHAKNMKEPVNPNDPYGFMEEFSLAEYDKKYTEEKRTVQNSAPPIKKAKKKK